MFCVWEVGNCAFAVTKNIFVLYWRMVCPHPQWHRNVFKVGGPKQVGSHIYCVIFAESWGAQMANFQKLEGPCPPVPPPSPNPNFKNCSLLSVVMPEVYILLWIVHYIQCASMCLGCNFVCCCKVLYIKNFILGRASMHFLSVNYFKIVLIIIIFKL